MNDALYTIGHSNHSLERLMALLAMHGITAVGDVRSQPYSRRNPQFNRESFQKSLNSRNIAYVFLGQELGARRDDPACYQDGRVVFSLVAETALFKEGLTRVRTGMQDYRICLMCAEKDPVFCHRFVLVCRHLRKENTGIRHILEDGSLEGQGDAERRLIKTLKLAGQDLFLTTRAMIEMAYDTQSGKIAYTRKDKGTGPV